MLEDVRRVIRKTMNRLAPGPNRVLYPLYKRRKVFFSGIASMLTEYVLSNKYVDTSIQKGGIPGVPGCIEHFSMIWEAKRRRLNLCGSTWQMRTDRPHQLIWMTCAASRSSNYSDVF